MDLLLFCGILSRLYFDPSSLFPVAQPVSVWVCGVPLPSNGLLHAAHHYRQSFPSAFSGRMVLAKAVPGAYRSGFLSVFLRERFRSRTLLA